MEEVVETYIPIVATPLKNGEAAPILNEETYNTLKGMLASNDEHDHKMAQLILNTCDIKKSIYWIWKLCQKYISRMINLRTKASRELRDKAHLYYIYGSSPIKFAEFLDKQGWITPEIYKHLESSIVSHVLTQVKNRFYNVEITIKDKYKDLPETVTPISRKDE